MIGRKPGEITEVLLSSLTRRLPALATISLTALTLAAAPAVAGTANGGLRGAPRSNPLAGMRWGVYTGPTNGVHAAYESAGGRERALLAKIATRPLAYWFGAWFPDRSAAAVARDYIANQTGGDPGALAQATIFRLDPWEQAACSRTPGPGAQASYRAWVDGFADGIGRSRIALILQPDLPFAACAPTRVPLELVAYAAKRFSALPHATVYIDAGAAAWEPASRMARMLIAAGVRHVRGFALNVTQYGSTGLELGYGAQIAGALAGAGVAGKHFVINTAENGAPFLAGQYPGDSNNPRACASRGDAVCATLGIPPTWRTADARWHLSPHDRSIAARLADAYLWIGRPWLNEAAGTFNVRRALSLAASSPF